MSDANPERPCPACGAAWDGKSAACPGCGADLRLLAGLADDLGTRLRRADDHTKAGRLAEAVGEYLGALALDPNQPMARQRLGWLACVLPVGEVPVAARAGRPWGWIVAVLLALACGWLAGRR